MPLAKEIRNNEDFIAKSLNIGVMVDEIMAEINVFDWMELQDKPEAVIEDIKQRVGFKASNNKRLREKAFLYKFEQAIRNLSALVEEVHASYNIPSKKGINNKHINQYYYLKYWADKKAIAVDYNETEYHKRKLFNFYTILFDIFADKMSNFNAYNVQKDKTK